ARKPLLSATARQRERKLEQPAEPAWQARRGRAVDPASGGVAGEDGRAGAERSTPRSPCQLLPRPGAAPPRPGEFQGSGSNAPKGGRTLVPAPARLPPSARLCQQLCPSPALRRQGLDGPGSGSRRAGSFERGPAPV